MAVLNVFGMTCQGCVRAVERAIASRDPDASVTVDLAAGRVIVTGALPAEAAAEAIRGAGYDAEPAAD